MSHLSPDEFVDAAEGALDARRAAHLDARCAAHLETCGACRARASQIAGALSAAQDAEIPEPSPLYWGHLSARIREAVAHEAIVPAWRAVWSQPFGTHRLVPIASAVALAGAVVVSGLMLREGRIALPGDRAAGGPASVESVAADDSEAWQMLTSVAADTPMEDAHPAGMGVPAGAIDRAVQRMTPDELNALGQLLQTELHKSGD